MNEDAIKARAVVDNMATLTTGWPDLTIAELRQKLGQESVHKLSFNENPYGPSPKAVEAMRESACQVNLYGDMEAKELRRKIANHYDLGMDCVFVTNGGDEAINLLAGVFVSPGDEVLTPWPTFGQYAAAALFMDGKPVRVPLRKEDQRVDFSAMLAAMNAHTKVIFLCNPNNPTGLAVCGSELRDFLGRIPANILVCLDEAYAEYVTDSAYASGVELMRDFSNVAVIRTFSKIYGLAGIRVGYGIAAATIVEKVQRIRSPFNVNSLAQCGAMAALDDRGFIMDVAEKNAVQRELLSKRLQGLGWRVLPSQTNFLFVDTGRNTEAIAMAARQRGFILRAGAWGYPTYLRISLGTAEQNETLAAILAEASR